MKDIYWHIQMHLPEGKGGTVIDSEKMLLENSPIIGTGEWDDKQCRNFKGEANGIKIGDIVMVRIGNMPLALCEILDDYFTDDELEEKYINKLYRHVKVLDWNTTKEKNSLFSQGTLKPLYKWNNTDSWHYINNWYKKVLNKNKMNNLIDILKAKYQIILQGAPGTGKTYTAKDIAEQLIFGKTSETKQEQKEKLENSKQYKLVQFHPSYTYEDFVRGIAVETNSGIPNYKTVNKILGDFAKEALQNWDDSKKQPEILSREKWVEGNLKKFKDSLQEKLDREDEKPIKIKEGTSPTITAIEDNAFRCNRYHNPNDSILIQDSDIINGYIGLHLENPIVKIKDNPNLSKSARSGMYYLYQNLIALFKKYLDEENIAYIDSKVNQESASENNYILIIDEINRANLPAVLGELIYALEYRGESVESMYAIDGENKLTLPPNLYIIGTMNTADRSVGQIDYAIRRRFAFIDMLPHVLDDVDGFDSELFEQVSKLFIENYDEYKNNPKTTLKRSAHLSEEFRPEDVWLGHSYFIMKKDGKDCRDMRLHYEIKPILKEYLKDGIFKSSAEEIINSLS
jgi:MoxR-like ATPase